jgi:hypothetical protein
LAIAASGAPSKHDEKMKRLNVAGFHGRTKFGEPVLRVSFDSLFIFSVFFFIFAIFFFRFSSFAQAAAIQR